MKSIFLESHNIKNLHFGFGQFNYHLIKGLYNAEISDFKMTLLAKNIYPLQSEFGNYFNYKIYKSYTRYSAFRIRKKYDLWHSLNQNIKIEPFHNIPYLLTVHDVNFIEENANDKKRRDRFTDKLNRSHAITYISNYAKASTHKHFNVPKVPEYVIYNGNPIKDVTLPDNFRPKITTKRPFLFSIGEFTERKNFHALVNMLVHLKDFDLVLAGNNNTAYTKDVLLEAVKNNNLEDRVFIIGKINDIEKQYYLKHCSAFVFPSLREGFGIPPIEAMRFGKPVILSKNTSLPEIGGEHASYWEHYDSEYMAEVVTNSLHQYENNKTFYIQEFIKRAKSFNWDTSALEYAKVYKSLL